MRQDADHSPIPGAETSSPEMDEVLLQLDLQIALDTGDLEQAIHILENHLQKDPAAFKQYNDLGVIFFQKQDYEKALEAFHTALKTAPFFETTYENLLNLYLQMGYAEPFFQTATHLIALYSMNNKMADAGDLLQDLLTIFPQMEDTPIRKEIAADLRFLCQRLEKPIPDFLENGKYEEASDWENALELYYSGNFEMAKIEFERLLNQYPDSTWLSIKHQAVNIALYLDADHKVMGILPSQNLELNQKELADRKTCLDSTPIAIEIGTTLVCNINPPCVQCWKHIDPNHGYLKKDAHHIRKEIYLRLIPFISRAGRLSLHGVGEPLTCPYLFEPLKYSTSETKITFVSNALLLNQKNIDRILDNHVHLISFSLDAATPETYKKIRHNDFNKVVSNIKNLIKSRD